MRLKGKGNMTKKEYDERRVAALANIAKNRALNEQTGKKHADYDKKIHSFLDAESAISWLTSKKIKK